MPEKTWLGGEMHKSVLKMAEDAREGRTSRREFLATATALGVTSAAALAMIGAAPTALADGHKKMGGTLNVSMIIKDIRDPRLFDWSEMGNVARHVVEPLVQTARGWLLLDLVCQRPVGRLLLGMVIWLLL